VLGQDFVAFRDSRGRYGFLDEACCHRNASLVFGRVEDGGLRCIYHGWKYDVDGKILEMPNCADPRMMERFRQGNYPVVAAGGLGWVYLGPVGTEPDFPRYSWTATESVSVHEMVFDCNWVQIQEGSLDTSHVGILHIDTLSAMHPGVPRDVGSLHFDGEKWDHTIDFPPGVDSFPSADNTPRIDLEVTPFGFQYGAVREANEPGKSYVRVTALGFPFTAHIGGSSGAVIVVPRDDDNCSFIAVKVLPAGSPPAPTTYTSAMPPTATTDGDLSGGEVDEASRGQWTNDPTETRRYRLPTQDRAAMATRASFAGFLGGNRPQDGSVQGVNARSPRFSRATENLVPADVAIIRFRRMLLEAARLVEDGKEPPGRARDFDFSGVRAASEVIDRSTPWQDLVPGNSGKVDVSPTA
jgi:phthalate 4,5-dioxygenase